jgi:2-isopropylmalate synthase
MIQVLTQSRERPDRDQSFEAWQGAKTAIVHLYNAVSPLWRRSCSE